MSALLNFVPHYNGSLLSAAAKPHGFLRIFDTGLPQYAYS